MSPSRKPICSGQDPGADPGADVGCARISDVVFDLGNVLVDWDPRYLFRGRFGDDEQAMEHFLAHVCSPEWHREIDRGLPWRRAIAQCSARHPDHAEHISAYRYGWEQMFAGEVPGAVAVLGALKAAGLRLHALSNYPAEPVDFLYRRFAWMSHFEHVVISGLLGCAKPEVQIYRHLLGRIQRTAESCVFIDDRADNVAAAAALGFDAIRFEDARQLAAALQARGLLQQA